MSFQVLVTVGPFLNEPGEHKRIIQEAGCELVDAVTHRLNEEQMEAAIPGIDGIILGLERITPRIVRAATRLRVISRYGVGIDNIDLEACTEAGIVVTSTQGANHVPVAELGMGLLLALARQIPQGDRAVRDGQWKGISVGGIELAEKTIGIVGLGRVGLAMAQRARGFDMTVHYYDVFRRTDLEAEGWLTYTDLDTLITTSDVVSLHSPSTPETHNLINEARLRRMKPTALLVNTARGDLIDEDALFKALQEGWIAGAAADAFVNEPPLGSPLLTLNNFIASPHAGSATPECRVRMNILAARNLVAIVKGERPPTVVNPAVFLRQ